MNRFRVASAMILMARTVTRPHIGPKPKNLNLGLELIPVRDQRHT